MKIEEIMARAAWEENPRDVACVWRRDTNTEGSRYQIHLDVPFDESDNTEEILQEMRAAIAALEQAGYQIVPVEPTINMQYEGATCWKGFSEKVTAKNVYKAMIKRAKKDMA